VEDHGDPDLSLGVVELLAVAASQTGQHERAVRLAASAAEQRARGQLALADPDRDFLDHRLAESRAVVGAHLDRLEQEGRSIDVTSALTQAALVGRDPPG